MMKKIIIAVIVLCAPLAVEAKSPVLIELYTSQGCSSCPPADRFAGELTKREDVLVLSLPVTYWDRLGWKDSLAKAQFTTRQRRYARAMKESIVYTPQMVVDGKFHVVGSSRAKVYRLIKQQKKNKRALKITLQKNKGKVILNVKGEAKNNAILWRADFIKQKHVSIGAGENQGRTITYYNVVKNLRPLGAWRNQPLQKTLSPIKNTDGVAIFIQEKNHGQVFASNFILLK